jgi:hypothetical protein
LDESVPRSIERNDSRTQIHPFDCHTHWTSHNLIHRSGCVLDLETRPRADSRPEITAPLEDIRRTGLAFLFDKETIFTFDRDAHKDELPLEIPSHSRIVIYANSKEWKQLEALGTREKIMNWKFVAVAVTETGGRFTSNRFKVWIARPLWFLRDRLSKKGAGVAA